MRALSLVSTCALLWGLSAHAVPVPGYVPPVVATQVPDYADATRGVFVPNHQQHRLLTEAEQQNYGRYQVATGPSAFQQQLQQGPADETARELNRIANDNGLLQPQQMQAPQAQPMFAPQGQQWQPHTMNPYQPSGYAPAQQAQWQLAQAITPLQGQPSLADDPRPLPPMPMAPQQMLMPPVASGTMMAAPNAPMGQAVAPEPHDQGVEMLVGQPNPRPVDMTNTVVRLRDDRVSVRRTLQRMMDQIGAGDWQVIWDLQEDNVTLPEMEISIYTEEPFTNVLNALLARIQSRAGQPLRVIRYDNTKRLVITDRTGGHRLAKDTVSGYGTGPATEAVVTERVLKEAKVSLHYDEIPLVDALENVVNQAGRGQWRLRIYAGLDQVLKPAHIEEPFGVAMERLLRLFNLKYEIFPGGKLVVVTANNRMGFEGVGMR